jgi:glycerol kinase
MFMETYIIALDQGTTSSRAILVNKSGKLVGKAQKEFPQFYPKTGWVEQNPEDIWQSQYNVAKEVLDTFNILPEQISGIGITNQRETTIVWEKETGLPVYSAIVWQDKRTSGYCQQLKDEGWSDYIQENTGLIIDSYFSATKIRWILNNVEDAAIKAQKGQLLFGTVDSWIIWKLTGGKTHITDYTNASRTLLFNIKTLTWDKQLLELFGVPESMLPKVVPSSGVLGHTLPLLFGGVQIPISGVAGDQQAALFGQTTFEIGAAKNTYGTGCFILLNTGTKQIVSKQGLISTLTCLTKANHPEYALEGSVFIAGAAIKWLRDALHLISDASDTEKMIADVADTHGVYVVPAFSGLGAPYWDMQARGAIFGLTQGVTHKHIIKATLESLAYQSKEVIDAMEREAGCRIHTLNVDGGASINNYLMQFQADMLDALVVRPANIETTAMGAAFLAGLATGFWNNVDELKTIRSIDQSFSPKMERQVRTKLYQGWQKAVSRTMKWEEED